MRSNLCAHNGILSNGVKIPLKRMNTIMKKNALNTNCCWVPENVDIKRESPSTESRKINALSKSSGILPKKGILKTSFPIIRPMLRSISPIIRKGTILAIIN